MKHLLRAGAMTPAAVADELDVKEETVKRTMRRHKRLFTLVKGNDGDSRLGLFCCSREGKDESRGE